MRIGELAKVTDTPVETIRYYEREGLMTPHTRTEGNFRIYADTHVELLTFIRYCRSLDMSLKEIRMLLRLKETPDENCNEVNELLDAHIIRVAKRIRELHALGQQLKSLRGLCREGQDAIHCGILNELSHMAHEKATHTGGKLRSPHGSIRQKSKQHT